MNLVKRSRKKRATVVNECDSGLKVSLVVCRCFRASEREKEGEISASQVILTWGFMESAATKCGTVDFDSRHSLNFFFLLFYHWQHNSKWSRNEKWVSFKILVRLCSSFSQLKRPINWIIREHIKPHIYFLSTRDIKALWTTTVKQFQCNPSLFSFPPSLFLSLHENCIYIQVLLDITDLSKNSHFKVPASTYQKP